MGPGSASFLLLTEAAHLKNCGTFDQVLGANFGASFGDTFLFFMFQGS